MSETQFPEKTGTLENRAENPDDIILHAEKITKVYPGTTALNNVDFDAYRGKVNVLVGENGAGKSTLMKILAGVEQPTSGKLYLEGKEISNGSIKEAGRNGIGIIFQEMMVFPNLTVTENIFTGREKRVNGIVSYKEQRAETVKILKKIEQNINPDQLVG